MRINLRQTIKQFVPRPFITWRQARLNKRQLPDSLKPLYPRTCPVCDYQGSFTHFGRPPRLDARCPSCGSLERHRLFWLWYKADKSQLKEPILHFAPEKLLEQTFRKLYKEYSTADLFKDADLKLNIEKIDLPSGSFNTIICNHVLEHVSDRQALAEISRILSAEGFFIVSVPIIEGWEHTYENDSIRDPLLRELHFGQSDHARYYGRDFRDRLKDAGFNKIEEVTSEGQNVMDYGLLRGEKFFVCSKG